MSVCKTSLEVGSPSPALRRGRNASRTPLGRRRAPLVLAAIALGFSACTVQEVTEVEITSVSVFPTSANAIAGETLQLSATVVGELGDPLPAAPEWTTDAPEIATVDASGMVTAHAQGTVTVRAAYRGAHGDATVRVFPGPGIELSRQSTTFAAERDGAAPASAIVYVTNGGTGTLDGLHLVVRYEGSRSGWLSAELAAEVAPTRIVLSADPSSLPTGRLTGLVDVLSSRPGVSPQTIAVALEITDPPPAPEPPPPPAPDPPPPPSPDPEPDPDPGPTCTKDSPDWPSCKTKGKKGRGG